MRAALTTLGLLIASSYAAMLQVEVERTICYSRGHGWHFEEGKKAEKKTFARVSLREA